MAHFLEGIAPLRHWYINQNEKSNKYKSSLTKALMGHFVQGNVPLKHLLNVKTLFCLEVDLFSMKLTIEPLVTITIIFDC